MKYQIDNITVKELYQLDDSAFDEYMAVKKIMKVNDSSFMKHDATPLGHLTFGEVGELKQNMRTITSDSLFESFQIIYGVKLKEYLNANVIQYFYALKYIEQEVIALMKKEKKMLSSEPDFEMKQAGIDRMKMFGDSSTLFNLGKAFSCSPLEIESWKYNLVFMILVYDKTSSEIQKRYSELKKGKR